MSTMERSAEIDEAITTIREMPQNDKETSLEKKEAARELRMEILLSNAQLIKEVPALIVRNPEVSKKDLVELLARKLPIIHPEKTEKFVNNLLNNRDKFQRVREQLEKNGNYLMIHLPANSRYVVCTDITTAPLKEALPGDETYYGTFNDSYPLAVSLKVSPDLFKDLYNNDKFQESSAGFFGKSGYHVGTSTGLIPVPLIVVRDTSTLDVSAHEEGHNLNSVFQDIFDKNSAAEKASHVFLWGGLKVLYTKTVDILKTNSDVSDPILKDTMAKSLEYMLSCAKDELLADYPQVQPLTPEIPMRDHLYYLKNDPLYDYTFRHLGLDKESTNYKILREKYLDLLDVNTQAAMSVVTDYKFSGWTNRVDLLRNVLMQCPVATIDPTEPLGRDDKSDFTKRKTSSDSWSEYLQVNLFEKESNLAKECTDYLNGILDQMSLIKLGFLSPPNKSVVDELVKHYLPKMDVNNLEKLKDKFYELQQKFEQIKSDENSTTPMLKPLEKLRYELYELYIEAEQTFESSESYQYRVAYEKLISRFQEKSRDNMRNRLNSHLVTSDKSFYGTLTLFQKENSYYLEK